jgi:AcrR family transcriptional regulator
MAPGTKDTKRRIIDAAYGLFYRGGFARTGVDDIAAAAGVTKRTLYYHFASKDALVAAVLALQHELALAQIQGWAQRVTGDPPAVVGKLFTEFAAWAREPRWRGSGFTRAAMEFAHLPGHPARLAARRHKAEVEAWLADQLGARDETRPLARQIMLLLEGCHALILIHGDPTYAVAAGAAARVLVERQRPPSKNARRH